jgi:hypothetical protein
VELARNSGRVAPKPQGGDQRSARIEAHALLILGMVEKTPDVTLDVTLHETGSSSISVGLPQSLWVFLNLCCCELAGEGASWHAAVPPRLGRTWLASRF